MRSVIAIFKRVEALVLSAVGAWCFLVAFAGALLGLVLGNIRLPVFLLLAGNPAAAGGANIAVSGLAAAAGAVTHIRAGRVDWRLAGLMLPSSIVGAVAGGYAAGWLPGDALRIAIGVLLVLFGLEQLRPRRTAPRQREEPDVRAAVVAGGVIGVIGGLIGLILGTLRVPALIRLAGQEPARAVGTNLVIGIAVGAAGLLGHLPGGIDWRLLAVGAATSVPGALLGSRYTGRLDAAQLLHAIGAILVLSGTITIVRGLV